MAKDEDKEEKEIRAALKREAMKVRTDKDALKKIQDKIKQREGR